MEGNTQAFGTIGWAVKQLHNGLRVQRKGWMGVQVGGDMYLVYAPPGSVKLADEVGGQHNTAAAIFIKNAMGDFAPWNASSEDLLALDWQTAPE
jgi:hypothetical protein